MGSHRDFLRLLDDPFFPFPPSSASSAPCPLLDFDLSSPFPASPFHDLDLFLRPLDPFPAPSPHAFLLHDLTDRVASLELALAARHPDPTPARRKYTYVTESAGRKVKWTVLEKPRAGERTFKWDPTSSPSTMTT
ncbi:hypothetical protein ACP70R_042043 [Stipagrostis hirtigluma subsp. patula]